jgi:hypothetical protein
LNIEFFSSTMNDDRIFFKFIMLIFNSNNFHFWIEELKDLALKIKIWEYIISYNQIAKSRKKILLEIFHFDIRTFAFAFSIIVDDLITNQINQFVQASQSRSAKYFHELFTFEQMWKNTNEKKSKSSKSLRECSK